MAAPPSRIACVTGASSGIGRASALALAAAGWTVVVSGRRQQELDETVHLAQERNKDAQLVAVAGDLSKPEDVDALFETIRDRFGRLDLLFNNAGRGLPAVPLEDVPLADFQSIVAINLVAPFLCTQHAFRIMRDQQPQGGRIINNGSISAHAPRPLSAPYTLTKHAITGLTKSTSLDGRAYHIACSQIDIGTLSLSLPRTSLLLFPDSLPASQATLEAMVDELRRGAGSLQPNGSRMHEDVMPVEAVADSVVHMASLPLHVNILTQTIMANAMPFVGRG